MDEVNYAVLYSIPSNRHLTRQREHLAAVVGLHPSFKTLSRLLPDPFFIHGHRSSTGLVDLARKQVTKRLNSGHHREDILDKLIQARMQENGALTPGQVTELIAETVTLLCVYFPIA